MIETGRLRRSILGRVICGLRRWYVEPFEAEAMARLVGCSVTCKGHRGNRASSERACGLVLREDIVQALPQLISTVVNISNRRVVQSGLHCQEPICGTQRGDGVSDGSQRTH